MIHPESSIVVDQHSMETESAVGECGSAMGTTSSCHHAKPGRAVVSPCGRCSATRVPDHEQLRSIHRVRCPRLSFGIVLTPQDEDRVAPFTHGLEASRKSHKSALDVLRTKPSVAEALRRAQVEQAVEDYNGQLRLEGGAAFGLKAGRFIVMPITELLDPPKGSVLHGKLQYSDKVMLPKSFLYEILNRRLEPPWNFEIEPLQGDPLKGYEAPDDEETEPVKAKESKSAVPRVYCSNFDFRAPENYIFVPDWMMRTLKLKPRDVVSLKFVRLPADGVVTFRPHSAEFSRLANAHAVLEAELKYYSCVTRGTTIRFKYNNRVFDLDVEDIRDAANNPAQALKMQDSDVQTDIKPPREEEEKEARRRQQQQKEKAKGSPLPPPVVTTTTAGQSGGSGGGTKAEL